MSNLYQDQLYKPETRKAFKDIAESKAWATTTAELRAQDSDWTNDQRAEFTLARYKALLAEASPDGTVPTFEVYECLPRPSGNGVIELTESELSEPRLRTRFESPLERTRWFSGVADLGRRARDEGWSKEKAIEFMKGHHRRWRDVSESARSASLRSPLH